MDVAPKIIEEAPKVLSQINPMGFFENQINQIKGTITQPGNINNVPYNPELSQEQYQKFLAAYQEILKIQQSIKDKSTQIENFSVNSNDQFHLNRQEQDDQKNYIQEQNAQEFSSDQNSNFKQTNFEKQTQKIRDSNQKMEIGGVHLQQSIHTETNPENQNMILDINIRIRMEFCKQTIERNLELHSQNFGLKNLIGNFMRLMDYMYQDKPQQKFYIVETIIRVPLMSFISSTHYMETIGYHENTDQLKVYQSQSWNVLQHLLINKYLGGSQNWTDRFIAQHISLILFQSMIFMNFMSPEWSYKFQEYINEQAYQMYDKYLSSYEKQLKQLPAPQIAIDYYQDQKSMFDQFQEIDDKIKRQPTISNLYDVYSNIRNDYFQHFKSIIKLQDQLFKKNYQNVPRLTDNQQFQIQNLIEQLDITPKLNIATIKE